MCIRQLHYEDVAAVAYAKVRQQRKFGFDRDLWGEYQTATTDMGGLLVSDWKWDITENCKVKCGELTDLIFFSISDSGSIITEMNGLHNQEEEKTGQGGLYFWSEGCNHKLKKDTVVSGLSIAMDTKYFTELIANEGAWGETLSRKIEKYEPFWLGGHQSGSAPMVKQLLTRIRTQSDQGINRLMKQAAVSELLYSQLDWIKRSNDARAFDTPILRDDIDKLFELRKFIEQNFLEEFSLPQLVRIGRLNEFKLKKGFRQLFGQSVFRYIHSLRMEYAGNLLRHNKVSIAEAAQITGYQYAQHFSTAFSKYFGVTPTAWIR